MGEPAMQLEDEELEERPIGPQPGPQTAFAECAADIAFYGGTAGSGKSFALLYEPVKWCVTDGVRGFRGVLFRRTSTEILGGGGLWDESQQFYRDFGGRPRGMPALDWTFEAETKEVRHRHRIEFRHLQHEHTIYEHQGRQYAFIGFDEVTHFSAKQFWYLVSRCRSSCGVRPYVRGTCNPDPDSFVFEMIRWWLSDDGYPILERSGVLRWFVRVDDALVWFDSETEARAEYPSCRVVLPDRTEHAFANEGEARAAYPDAVHEPRAARRARVPRIEFDVEPMSFTFIAARLSDNQILLENDPTYRTKLLSMSRVDRMRLLGDPKRGGNWQVRDSAGLVFDRSKVHIVDRPPSPIVATVRFWDKAHSAPTPKHPDPDWTRGVRVSRCENGEFWIDALESARLPPGGVNAMMREVAERDGIEVAVGTWRESGFAGKTDATTTYAVLATREVLFVDSFSADVSAEGFASGTRSSRAKRAFARSWVPVVEEGRLFLAKAEWNEELLAEVHAFPDARHDDIVDAISGAMQLLNIEPTTSLAEAMKAVD